MIKKAIQTITWGDPQQPQFDAIFRRVAESGFTGLEIGYRRLAGLDPTALRTLLDEHGLQLISSHVGGNLDDLGQAEAERNAGHGVLPFLQALGVRHLLYSGLRGDSAEELDRQIAALNDFGIRCRDHGIHLLYHNHDWEFAGDAFIWRRLLERRGPEVGFAPDLGWAAAAGQDLAALFGEIGDGLRVLHFKDFRSLDGAATDSTVPLGTGAVDFAPAWDWLAEQGGREVWITAEQDTAPDADAACVANGRYFARHIEGACHV